MKVLIITGDKRFRAGHPRFDLQRAQVDALAVLYWGRDALWPTAPSGHFDVVTAQDPFWRGLVGLYFARRLKTKLNVQVHADLAGQSFVKHVLGQIVLRHADSVRVVSEKIRQQVLAMGARVPIHVLPVYIDIERFKNIEYRLHDEKTILWIGRFEPEKDPLQMLEIFRAVRATFDAKLIMLGAGSMQELLHARAKALPVEFPGWRDPKSYLAESDVVVCTSKHESFGVSIVEALAAGVPVVAPDVGVAKEAGAVVVPREELADAVINLLRLGAKGALTFPVLSAKEWAGKWRESLT